MRSCRLASTSDSAARPATWRVSSSTGSAASDCGVPVRRERDVEPREVFGDALVRDLHVRDADRHLGHDARDGEPVPQDALLLDAAQALVEVGDVHARAHVLRGRACAGGGGSRSTSRATRGGMRWRRSARSSERSKTDGRELVERLADVERAAAGRRRARRSRRRAASASARSARWRARAAAAARRGCSFLASSCALLRLLGRVEGGAVPGRVVRSVAELAEARRRGSARPPTASRSRGERLDGVPAEPCRGRRRRRAAATRPRQLAQRIQHRDAEHGVAAGERGAVVEQHLAQAHERLVDVGDLRLRRPSRCGRWTGRGRGGACAA